jgi:hypothetical protein
MKRCDWPKPTCHEVATERRQMLVYCKEHAQQADKNRIELIKQHRKSQYTTQIHTDVPVKDDFL